MAKDRNTALREAALLRNRIESCLKAAASQGPMTTREIQEIAGVREVVGPYSERAIARVSAQLSSLAKARAVLVFGDRNNRTYGWNPEYKPTPITPAAQRAASMPELHIQVNKTKRSLRLVFEGLALTVEVI